VKPTLEVFVAGKPKGQPRPKAFSRGNHAGVYDPGTAEEWKGIVRQEVKARWDGQPWEGPVSLTLQFSMPRPKDHFNRKGLKATAPNHHVGRPDADNLAKAIMDALTNLGIWKDDSQVAVLRVSKSYVKAIPLSCGTGCACGAAGCTITIGEI
jgi:Holliday junction resolvase RusA-like endonuclease